MPNQLYVPFKRTWDVPLRQAAREYILKKYTDTHPDAFRWDITRWETLRKDGAGGIVHIDRVQASLRCVTHGVVATCPHGHKAIMLSSFSS